MTTKDKALRMALAALEWDYVGDKHQRKQCEAITAIREVLAQPEQESVKFNCTVVDDDNPNGVPLSKWFRQPEREPFCYHDGRNIVGKEFADHSDVFPLYTSPPPRKPWVGLTDEDKSELDEKYGDDMLAHLDAIEAKLKEKNT